MHSLLLLPDFEAAERIADRLSQIRKYLVRTVGRHFGLTGRDLLELALDEWWEFVFIFRLIYGRRYFSVFGEFSGILKRPMSVSAI